MNAIQEAAKGGLIQRFFRQWGLSNPGTGLSVLENPTEEIDHDLARGKRPKLFRLFGAGAQPREIRREENYLYSTRRFPSNTANNTIGAGAVVAGDYDFFGNGQGDSGNSMGYFSITNLSYLQTNMEKGGKIPRGKGYKLFELGVSFNAQALGADVSQLLDTMNLKFDMGGGNFTIQHGPLLLWPGGVGVSGYASAATTVAATTINVERASNGSPFLGAARRLKDPRILAANDTFKYTITAVANTPRTNVAVALSDFVEVRIWLFGYHYDAIKQ